MFVLRISSYMQKNKTYKNKIKLVYNISYYCKESVESDIDVVCSLIS